MAPTANSAPLDSADEPHSAGILGIPGIAWRHKWILTLGLAVGLMLGALFNAQLAPEYQSSLKLLIVKKRPDALPLQQGVDSRLSLMEDYLSTHQVLIRSPSIVHEAVTKENLQALPSFTGDPTGEIIRSLSITREATEGGSTNILTLTYRSPVAENCPIILNAIKESYKSFLDRTYQNVSKETVDLIQNAKDQLEKNLAKKEKAYQEFREKQPILLRGKDGMSVRQERLFSIESKRSSMLVKQAEIGEQLATFREAIKSGTAKTMLIAIAESNGQSTDSKEDKLGEALLQEQALLVDFGEDHPQVQAMRKRIKMIRGFKSSQPPEIPEADPIQAHLQSLQRELAQAKTSERALSKILEKERAEAQESIADEIADENFRKDLARQQQLFDTVLKRLQEVDLFKSFGGYDAREIAPAGPAVKVGPRTIPIYLMAAMMGLLVGAGLAYVAEISDQSFRNPEDVRQALHLPIVGQVPDLAGGKAKAGVPDAAALAPILCAYHKPKSREAEAYRGVRTSLFFSTQGKGHRVIQVTSPNVGDGKSTLASNLAISIAQAEKKVILIDADFRKPTLHKLFGVSDQKGFTSVLMGEMDLAQAIQPSRIERLSILGCGPLPANPAELLSLPHFRELIEAIRQQYDFVIIDTPPLLAVSDPCIVSPLVDGVLLTLRLSKNGRTAAKRAKDILATLDATVIGVVVNAVNDKASGYGYGYGYGENYYAKDADSPGQS